MTLKFENEWSIPSTLEKKKMSSMKFYKTHDELFKTSSVSKLDKEASLLGMSVSVNVFHSVSIKNLECYERPARNFMATTTRADLFSTTDFKCLQQEKVNKSVLRRILESMAVSIRHSALLLLRLSWLLSYNRPGEMQPLLHRSN